MLTDSEPIGLTELRIQAFRGVTTQIRVRFDNAPVTILFGGNHSGKSSILNALDWILFSKDCFQGPLVTDRLRERVLWETRNRHVGRSLETTCTAVLSNGKATCELTRSLAGAGSRSRATIHIDTFDGKELTGETAEHFISTHVCPSFRDFMSTVYLHQEVIRDVLTIKPEERGDAIDRLLGLAPLRELARTLKDAKLGRFTQNLDNEICVIEQQVDAVRRDRQQRIDQRVSEAAEHKLQPQDVTFKHAEHLAHQSSKRSKTVASNAGLPAPEVPLPATEKDLERYTRESQDKLQSARTALPDVKKLSELNQRKTALSDARAVYEERARQRNHAKQRLADFTKEKGDRIKLEAERARLQACRKVKSNELAQHDARAAAVRDSIQYLQALPSPAEAQQCPVCGATIRGDDLLEHLEREAPERLDARSRSLSQELKRIDTELPQINQTLRALEQLEGDLCAAEEHLRSQREAVGKVLQIEITKDDDPKALLDRKLDQLDEELAARKEAADNRLSELDDIEEQYLVPLKLIDDILRERARLQELGRMQKRDEFKELRTLQRRAASLKAATEAIGVAAAAVSQYAAKQAVQRAGQRSRDTFVKIADNPEVRDVRLVVGEKSVGGILRNEYTIQDPDGLSVVPILSQGDMNALAIALLIGLGLSADSLPLRLMIFDDPTQSLATPQKERLADVLDDIAASRQIVVATMDAQFLDVLKSRVTKRKRVYEFRSWRGTDGPQIAALD